MIQKILPTVRLFIATLLLTTGAVAFATWAPPTATPPGNNDEGPINITSTPQRKGNAPLLSVNTPMLDVSNTDNTGLIDTDYLAIFGNAHINPDSANVTITNATDKRSYVPGVPGITQYLTVGTLADTDNHNVCTRADGTLINC